MCTHVQENSCGTLSKLCQTIQGFNFTHTENLLLVKELNLSKLVVVVGLISLVLQCLRNSGLRLESCLALVQVCLCHLLLLTVFVVLQEEGEREREVCTYVNVTRHCLHVFRRIWIATTIHLLWVCGQWLRLAAAATQVLFSMPIVYFGRMTFRTSPW